MKALGHLEYSYNKVQPLPTNYLEMDDEIMETWESFSSRGDIDLLLLTSNQTQCDLLKDNKYKTLVDIKNKIGDQKIDLLIISFEKAKEDSFVQVILPKSELIHRWD